MVNFFFPAKVQIEFAMIEKNWSQMTNSNLHNQKINFNSILFYFIVKISTSAYQMCKHNVYNINGVIHYL